MHEIVTAVIVLWVMASSAQPAPLPDEAFDGVRASGWPFNGDGTCTTPTRRTRRNWNQLNLTPLQHRTDPQSKPAGCAVRALSSEPTLHVGFVGSFERPGIHLTLGSFFRLTKQREASTMN
jgi:hypothetical protein